MHRELKRNLDLEALRVVAIGFTIPFWLRRAKRLLPAAMLWIVVSLIVSMVVGGDGVFPLMAKALEAAAAAAFQYFNAYWLTCRPENTCGTLGAYWSLSLENQFYFVLPIAAAVLTRRRLPVLFAVGFLAQFVIVRNITQVETLTPWVFRTDAICLGVLIAFWMGHRTYTDIEPRALANRGVGIAAFACLCIALAAFTHPSPWIGIQTGLVAVISAALVWVASYDRGYLVSAPWARALSGYIGARSYSVYLSHMFALYAVRDLFSRAGWFSSSHDAAIVVCFLVLTWILTELSYRFVERPMLPKGSRRPGHSERVTIADASSAGRTPHAR